MTRKRARGRYLAERNLWRDAGFQPFTVHSGTEVVARLVLRPVYEDLLAGQPWLERYRRGLSVDRGVHPDMVAPEYFDVA